MRHTGSTSTRLLTGLLAAGGDDHPALISGGKTQTYAELRSAGGNLARTLLDLGLLKGERVLIVLPNGPSFVTALTAIWNAGAVAVPLDPRIPDTQITRLAEDCGARGILCSGSAFRRLRSLMNPGTSIGFAVVERPEAPRIVRDFPVVPYEQAVSGQGSSAPPGGLDPDDLALLAYTSGSTGQPKGVMHSHRSLLSSLTFTREHVGITPENRVLVALPMHHLFALRVLLTHLLAGATVVAEADLFAGLRQVADVRVDTLLLVPAACSILIERFGSLVMRLAPRIRRVSIGSAAISPDVLVGMQVLLPAARFLIPYGMTEARIGFLEPVPDRAERKLVATDPNLEVRVLDQSGRPISEGLGEIVLSGPALMLGYWHNSLEENQRLRRDGFRTRDLMEVDESGERFLVGRMDDVINVGGEKVFPLEVEAVLRSHHMVRDAHVQGVEDPRGLLGQVVCANVVVSSPKSFDRDELITHCQAHLESYKVPVIVMPVNEIKRTETGKIVRLKRRGQSTEGLPDAE